MTEKRNILPNPGLGRVHGEVLRLESQVWPDTFIEEGGLTQNISVLRKLLNQPGRPELIETIRRRGYRFAGVVEEVRSADDAEVRVAVLPFGAPAAGEKVDLADGLTAAVIDSLTAIGPLRVTAFNTVVRYRGREVDPLRRARAAR